MRQKYGVKRARKIFRNKKRIIAFIGISIYEKNVTKKIWGSIGFIVNLAQMIECNLVNILESNEVLKTFDGKE